MYINCKCKINVIALNNFKALQSLCQIYHLTQIINKYYRAFYCGQPKAHLCNDHGLISIMMCHTCEVDGLSRQRRSAH